MHAIRWLPVEAIVLLALACGGRSREGASAIPGGAGGGFGGSFATGMGGATTGPTDGVGGGPTTTGTGGTSGNCGSCPAGYCWCPPGCNMAETAFASARIWQITDQEYVNVVRDVLGVTLQGNDAEISSTVNSTGEFTNMADGGGTFTDMLAQNYQLAAQKVAARASTPTSMMQLVGSTSPTTDQVAAFIAKRIPRLLRRPLRQDESDRLLKIYTDASANPEDGGPPYAFGLILEATLQWPSFLYRTELGSTTSPATSSFHLTPYELAAATSFALVDTAPDDELWSKAEDSTLTSPDVLAAEVDRLMNLPAAEDNLTKYLAYWLWVARVSARVKDVTLYPEYTPTLQQALYASGFAFLKDVLYHGTLSDLFTSNKVYLNLEMSNVFGIPGGTGTMPTQLQEVRSTLPERSAGLLTQPALLAATNKRPGLLDPVHHGLFVFEQLLGGGDLGDIPAPPPNALSIAARMMGTERELAEQRAMTAPCQGCHANFDPFGLLRSRYDSIGRYSATRYVNADMSVTPSKFEWATSPTPIDASAKIVDAVGSDLKGPLADTLALAALLNQDHVRRRVAFIAGRTLSTYVMGHDATLQNSCTLQDLKEKFYQTGSFTSFFKDLVTSPGFQTRDPG